MSLIDDGTQMASSITNQVATATVQVIFKVTSLTAATAPKIIGQALTQAREAHTNQPGRVSVPELQKLSGGDIHHQKIDPEVRRTLTKELKDLGVNFAVHKAHDGGLYVSFAGKDLPSLEHGLTQAEKRLDAKLAKQQTQPKTTQQPRTPSVLQRIKERAHALKQAPTVKAPTRGVGPR